MTRILLLAGAALVFGSVNWQVLTKERLRTSGQAVYLHLTPVDPRSLMQGDYMALNFAVAGEIGASVNPEQRSSGVAVLQLDPRRIGHFARLDTGGPLNANELRFRFRIRNGAVWLGTNAFFFEEGESQRYRNARFGEFRVNTDGEAMLVGLRDAELQLER